MSVLQHKYVRSMWYGTVRVKQGVVLKRGLASISDWRKVECTNELAVNQENEACRGWRVRWYRW